MSSRTVWPFFVDRDHLKREAVIHDASFAVSKHL
jgi:hypothetical protein